MREYKIKVISVKGVIATSEDDNYEALVLATEMLLNNPQTGIRVHVEEITEKTSIQMVKEFHKVFNHSIANTPQFPDLKNMTFRTKFMEEELEEITLSYMDKDLVAFADGLGDLQYVLDGWFLNAGLQDKKQAIMEEIHRSNMTKACKTVEEAEATIDYLVTKEAAEQRPYLAFHYEAVGEYYIVYRSHDGKVQKSINYQAPNLKPIIYG